MRRAWPQTIQRGALLFGIVWGTAVGVLIVQNEVLASVWVATLIAYLLRGKIVFLNHGVAVALAMVFFLATHASVDTTVFFVFLGTLLATGYLEDMKEIRLLKTYSLLDAVYYTAVPLGYLFLLKEPAVALSFIPFIVSYEITKYMFESRHHVTLKSDA